MNPTDYPFFISPLTEEDGGGFFIAFPDLPGCISDGETPAEAIQNGYDAARAWLETAKEFNDPILRASQLSGGLMMSVSETKVLNCSRSFASLRITKRGSHECVGNKLFSRRASKT